MHRPDIKKTVTVAELAMALALSNQLEPQTNQGRLKALFHKLETIVIDEFKQMKKLTDREKNEAKRLILEFADLVGWGYKPKHIATKINFLLAVLDRQPHGSKVIPALMDIYRYFERVKDTPAPCLWAGAVAADKWEKIKKERIQ